MAEVILRVTDRDGGVRIYTDGDVEISAGETVTPAQQIAILMVNVATQFAGSVTYARTDEQVDAAIEERRDRESKQRMWSEHRERRG